MASSTRSTVWAILPRPCFLSPSRQYGPIAATSYIHPANHHPVPSDVAGLASLLFLCLRCIAARFTHRASHITIALHCSVPNAPYHVILQSNPVVRIYQRYSEYVL